MHINSGGDGLADMEVRPTSVGSIPGSHVPGAVGSRSNIAASAPLLSKAAIMDLILAKLQVLYFRFDVVHGSVSYLISCFAEFGQI